MSLENTGMAKIIWGACFSQTGSEIVEISKALNRWPDVIITNRRPEHLRKIHPDIITQGYITLPNNPSTEDYLTALSSVQGNGEVLITLHGWLRILPVEIINKYTYIYNGHPGLINKYPELKGKDPQLKAWKLGLQTTGCVIHKVTEGIDEGPVTRTVEVPMRNLSLEELYENLHQASIGLWIKFLKKNWL